MKKRSSARVRRDVVAFGEILWDIYEQEGHDRVPRMAGAEGAGAAAGVPSRARPLVLDPQLGGAPANVVTTLARLGLSAAVVGGVGNDRLGAALVNQLHQDGVGTEFVLTYPARTGLTFISRDASGEPHFLFYRHATADMALQARDIVPAMGRARFGLVGTSTLMDPPLAKATYAFVDACRRGGASLVVDLNVRAHLWKSRRAMEGEVAKLLGHAALVKASEADIQAFSGGYRWLKAQAPDATWVLTRGAGEASVEGAHGTVHASARRATCVDATGAGDAFLAGVLAVLSAAQAKPGRNVWRDAELFQEALWVGHRLGAKAVSRVGAVRGITGLKPLVARLQKVRECYRPS